MSEKERCHTFVAMGSWRERDKEGRGRPGGSQPGGAGWDLEIRRLMVLLGFRLLFWLVVSIPEVLTLLF